MISISRCQPPCACRYGGLTTLQKRNALGVAFHVALDSPNSVTNLRARSNASALSPLVTRLDRRNLDRLADVLSAGELGCCHVCATANRLMPMRWASRNVSPPANACNSATS